MAGDPYYAVPAPWYSSGPWVVRKRARGGGDRLIGGQMSERTARRVARLLNADEATP